MKSSTTLSKIPVTFSHPCGSNTYLAYSSNINSKLLIILINLSFASKSEAATSSYYGASITSIKTLDHMIHAQIDFSKIIVKTTKEVPAFYHQCLINYCTLGFHRQTPDTLEEYMNQPLFLNRHIINLDTAQPWNRNEFEHITLAKLYRIGDIFIDRQLDYYEISPEIHHLPHPLTTAHLLNTKFSTPKKQINIAIDQWTSLINSIPPFWMNRITKPSYRVNSYRTLTLKPHTRYRHLTFTNTLVMVPFSITYS